MASMGKKRLVIDLDEDHHAGLVKQSRQMGLTVSNFVRQSLGLPLQRQGIKTQQSTKSARRAASGLRPNLKDHP